MPLKRKLLVRGKESPVGGPERPFEEGDFRQTEAGTEADVEDKEIDVVGGIDEVGISGYDSDGFTLSEIFRRIKTPWKRVSEGFVDATHLPQGELSNHQHLSH